MTTKIKEIDYISKEFVLEGYTLLSKEYINQLQKLDYICPNGHKRHTTWKNWKKGARCLICKNQSTRPSIDVVKESFEKDGYTLLSDDYVNNKTKLDYICLNGHKNSITWADWNIGGYRCPDCANNKRLSIEKVISDFELEGYTFISGDYVNNTSVLIIKCPKGHEFESSRVKWNTGSRCPVCYSERVNIHSVRESFEKENYRLLSDEYVDAHSKLKYTCPRGHNHEISWASWKQGSRCFYCRNESNRVSIEEIKNILHKNNCTLCHGSYNIDGSFNYICSSGHLCKAPNISSIKHSGVKCAKCYGNEKLKYSFVKDNIESEGYIVVTSCEEYFNNRTKLHLICPNNHNYYASWFDWNSNKVRCYKCNEKGTSLQEQEVIYFIKSICDDVEVHDRYLIYPKEIDILIPSKRIAIEYCGLYWHSELQGKDRNYHLSKLEDCKKVGFNLITIFEDEWVYKKDIVKSRLKNILGIDKDVVKIHARKCIIKEISITEASMFCEENHIQGYTGSSIKIGAFYGNELVSVMTFAKPSLSKGYSNYSAGVFELSRFCSKLNYNVVGIASKLLKYFRNNYSWSLMFSYADRRWSNGNLYNKIGFEFDSITKQNYWYFRGGDTKRSHRFVLRKKHDEPKDITEWEIRKSQGWNRIWDCGNLKYVINKEKED